MILTEKDDIIKALKRFRGLAKQAILVAQCCPGNEDMVRHAQSRKGTYERVIDYVSDSGVKDALRKVIKEYMSCQGDDACAEDRGKEFALEYSLQAFGFTPTAMKALRIAKSSKRKNMRNSRLVEGA